jgi:hypothetical protein
MLQIAEREATAKESAASLDCAADELRGAVETPYRPYKLSNVRPKRDFQVECGITSGTWITKVNCRVRGNTSSIARYALDLRTAGNTLLASAP